MVTQYSHFLSRIAIDEAGPARIMKSEPCSVFGEATMESGLLEVVETPIDISLFGINFWVTPYEKKCRKKRDVSVF